MVPFDIARCNGLENQNCSNCARKEPGREYYQAYILPILDDKLICTNFVENVYKKQGPIF